MPLLCWNRFTIRSLSTGVIRKIRNAEGGGGSCQFCYGPILKHGQNAEKVQKPRCVFYEWPHVQTNRNSKNLAFEVSSTRRGEKKRLFATTLDSNMGQKKVKYDYLNYGLRQTYVRKFTYRGPITLTQKVFRFRSRWRGWTMAIEWRKKTNILVQHVHWIAS